RQILPFRSTRTLLTVIVIFAAISRVIGLDWDHGTHLHPDERFLTLVETALKWPADNFIANYFDEAHSTLNPRNVGYQFFVYGDFPVALIKWVSLALNRTGYGEVYLVGRLVNAAVDVATVAGVFLLG